MNTGNGRFWTWIATGFFTILIVAAVNLLAHLPNKRFDLTEDQRYTLPEAAERIAAALEDTLTVNVYMTKSLPNYISHLPGIVRNRLDEFRDASKGQIEFKFIDPLEDKDLEQELADLKMLPSRLQDYDDGKISQANYYMWLEFLYLDQREQFNLADLQRALLDPATLMATLPYNMAARIVKVQNADQAIGVVSEKKMPPGRPQPGQPQPQPTAGIGSFLKGIESHYQEVQDVMIGPGNPISKDVTTLILYRPENLSDRAVFEIDQYLMRGNRVVVLLDNFALFDIDRQQEFGQGIQQNAIPVRDLKHNLTDWLKHYGIVVADGYVEDENCAAIKRLVQKPGPRGIQLVQQRTPVHGFVVVRERDKDDELTGQFSADSPVFTGLGLATMLFPTPMQVDPQAMSAHEDADVNALIRTSPDAWVRTPVDGKVAITSAPPEATEAPRGSHVLVAESHGKFKSFFAEKERPTKISPTGTAIQDPPNMPDKLDVSVEPGHLWVFADADFLSEWWAQLVNPGMMMRRGGPIPSQEAASGIARMATGLINTMDTITLGNSDLVDIRKPVLSDRSLRKESVEDNKSGIRLWTMLLAPGLLIAFGILNWITRALANRIPSPQRNPIQVSVGVSQGTPTSPGPGTFDSEKEDAS